jgi:hypothetical protein
MMALNIGRKENAEHLTLFSSSQLPGHFLAQRFPIGPPRNLRLKRFHYRAHFRLRGRANFRNGFAHDIRKLVSA